MKKLTAIFLSLLCTCSSYAMNDANMILTKYPNGWTCLDDIEKFRIDIASVEPDSDDDINDHIDTCSVNMIYRTIYERTICTLEKANHDLLLSLIYRVINVFPQTLELYDDFNKCLKRLLAINGDQYNDINESLGKTLWKVQYDALKRNDISNISYPLLLSCFSLLYPKHRQTIVTEIIPQMKKNGLSQIIPLWYKDQYE